jgi:heterodisulfide reductase subunit A-like polyferredoxin
MLTASLLIASVSPLHFQKNLFASGIMTESNATSKTPSVQQDPVVGVNEQYNGRTGEQHVEHLEDGCVLIAGGGPVGLVLATVLSYYGVKSVILERNATTTR